MRILDSHEEDWALLLARCTPGTALRDAGLGDFEQVRIGAELIERMAKAAVPVGGPFPTLVRVAAGLADIATERIDRLVGSAPIPLDRGLLVHAVDLLCTLPLDALVASGRGRAAVKVIAGTSRTNTGSGGCT